MVSKPTLVTREVFQKLAFGDRGEGVVLVAALPHTSLEQLPFSAQAVIGVLEHVEKPGNLGAIVRTADAAGVSAVVVADGGTDLYNPNAIRASLGAIFRVPVAAASACDVRGWLESHGAHVFAARVDASVLYTQVEYRRPCAIVLGSESHGLSEAWQGAPIQAIALPMRGIVDSLNVSVDSGRFVLRSAAATRAVKTRSSAVASEFLRRPTPGTGSVGDSRPWEAS